MEQKQNIVLNSERVIAYRPEISVYLGYDSDAAIVFQQLCYWQQYATRKDGFFYKSAEELEQETAIRKRSVHRIREKLIKLGFIEVKKEMANASPTYHYRILVSISTLITPSSDNLSLRSAENALSITRDYTQYLIVDFLQPIKDMSNEHRLYVGWLIEMVVGSRKWLATPEDLRVSLLESAAKKVKLTPKRYRKLSGRVSSIGFEMCQKAIRNCGSDQFYTGNNERGWKATLEWLFKDDEKIEELANRSVKR